MTKQELEKKVLENELRLQAIVESNLRLINYMNILKKTIEFLIQDYKSKITDLKTHINNE